MHKHKPRAFPSTRPPKKRCYASKRGCCVSSLCTSTTSESPLQLRGCASRPECISTQVNRKRLSATAQPQTLTRCCSKQILHPAKGSRLMQSFLALLARSSCLPLAQVPVPVALVQCSLLVPASALGDTSASGWSPSAQVLMASLAFCLEPGAAPSPSWPNSHARTSCGLRSCR